MPESRRLVLLALLALTLIGAVVWLVGPGDAGHARVTVVDENGTVLAVVDAAVADSGYEQYRGLSDTESLGPDEGMLFVFEEAETRSFVMRDMAFPIDIVFVGADGTITTIHEAPTEDGPPWTEYRGRGKWVLEVRAGYTDAHGIQVGDRVRIDRNPDD